MSEDKKQEIKAILDKYRKEPLAEDWWPVSVYCEKCKFEAEKTSYEGDYNMSYECECGDKQTFDIRKKGLVKAGENQEE